MARGDDDNLMNRLRQMSEEGITGLFNEILSNERMRSSFGRAGERFMANKQSFDRNVEQVLDFVNIPSKRDVRELKARLDHLSSQLLNLSIKLDRMLDHDEPTKAKPRGSTREEARLISRRASCGRSRRGRLSCAARGRGQAQASALRRRAANRAEQ